VHRDKIVAITMSQPSGIDWELRKTPEGWTVADARGATLPADEGEVNFVLVALTQRLRTEQYLSEDGRLERWARKLDVTLSDGTVRHLYLGDYSQTGAVGNDVAAAWIEGTTSVMQVGLWVRKDFGKTFEELRNRAIARFERAEATRIEFWRAGKMMAAVERAGENLPWKLAGTDRDVQQFIPNSLLMTLSRLKADKVEKEHPTAAELKDWELDPARKMLVVKASDGRVLAEVRIGKKISEEETLVMETSRKLVGRYGHKLEDLFPEAVERL
jgi:hypothetical protein